MRTIVVCGGAGFIGSHLVDYWLETHPVDRVVVYDLLTYAGNPANLADAAHHSDRYRLVHGDIGDHDALMRLFAEERPAYVVNVAAESHNSRAVLDPDAFFRTNVLGTVALAGAVRAAGVPRFHHVSTCEVYGDMALDAVEPFREDAPYRPRTPYNASKAGADLAIQAFCATYGLPATISICCNNYGPRQLPEKVIPYFTVRALRGEMLPLYRSSANRREWLHVRDHCVALDLILEHGRIGESYNVGSGEELDVEQIAAAILDELSLDASAKRYVEDRPGLDRRYLLDSSKIRRELGWVPTVELASGLRDTIRWYRDNPAWWSAVLDRVAVREDAWSFLSLWEPLRGPEGRAGVRAAR
jgi:dTDP-glucose 4,6-dehydratase